MTYTTKKSKLKTEKESYVINNWEKNREGMYLNKDRTRAVYIRFENDSAFGVEKSGWVIWVNSYDKSGNYIGTIYNSKYFKNKQEADKFAKSYIKTH